MRDNLDEETKEYLKKEDNKRKKAKRDNLDDGKTTVKKIRERRKESCSS